VKRFAIPQWQQHVPQTADKVAFVKAATTVTGMGIVRCQRNATLGSWDNEDENVSLGIVFQHKLHSSIILYPYFM
jgi:hypothetical protein